MNQVLYLFVVALGLATALAAICIWSPRAVWIKVGALVITALFLPATYVSVVELLSRPKPIALERKHADFAEARVLGADLREGEAIYLWLRIPEVEEPRRGSRVAAAPVRVLGSWCSIGALNPHCFM